MELESFAIKLLFKLGLLAGLFLAWFYSFEKVLPSYLNWVTWFISRKEKR